MTIDINTCQVSKVVSKYRIISKRYPLRLSIARKCLNKLHTRSFLATSDLLDFTIDEYLATLYSSIWISFEGFIDYIHTMFGLKPQDQDSNPKILAIKFSEIKKLMNAVNVKNIIWKNEDQIKNFRLDLEQLNTQFNVVTIEINNSNDNKSKTKRNFMSHCPITEGSTFREEHESIAAAELSRDIFYSSEVIGSHLVYGINIKSAEHMVKLFDGFMKLLTGFIKRYVNDGNFCFFAEDNQDTEILIKQLSLLNTLLCSEYDEEKLMVSGSTQLK